MRFSAFYLHCALLLLPLAGAAEVIPTVAPISAASISAALAQISADPDQTYRIRDLELTRGDIKIYLSEGILSFVTPIAGRRVAALFTTEDVEAGDAEILLLPPQRSERASLASFIKSPNLDEHFDSAILIFSDDTASELLNQIERRVVHKAPDECSKLAPQVAALVKDVAGTTEVQIIESLLDNHRPDQGLFFAVIGGRTLGVFDAMYDPGSFEPISLGRAPIVNGQKQFQLWTSFRPRHATPFIPAPPKVTSYRIDAQIHSDLSMSVTVELDLTAGESDGRAVPLHLSNRLKVSSATIDGQPVEVFQSGSSQGTELTGVETFLLITNSPLVAGTHHKAEIRYEGSVIRQTGEGSYFVDERNVWFPYSYPTLANFDLTFRCPARLKAVSTGELVSDQVIGDQRIVHRKTEIPEPMAGFNLGDFKETTSEHGLYRVECYANRSSRLETADIPSETEKILEYYTQRWTKLPIGHVAISPVPGYFGQGFPGLIYLSNIAYIPEKDRPAELRGPKFDTFFSVLLLPHETAHQWWGDVVTSANYRSAWLIEAMANYAALQFIGHTQSQQALDTILQRYREDITADDGGKPLDSAGPMDFGERLLASKGMRTWQIITYEKGSWALHMLHERLGDDYFRQMQVRLLRDFASKPFTNEDIRNTAALYVPSGQPDKNLSLFFDTWVYGTGIPKLKLNRTREGMDLTLSDVDDDFAADVPLNCTSRSGKRRIQWVRASVGDNEVGIPPDMASCSLPPPSAFLYSP